MCAALLLLLATASSSWALSLELHAPYRSALGLPEPLANISLHSVDDAEHARLNTGAIPNVVHQVGIVVNARGGCVRWIASQRFFRECFAFSIARTRCPGTCAAPWLDLH